MIIGEVKTIDAVVMEDQSTLQGVLEKNHGTVLVSARICRNVNGTDMSLFTQAIETRRKFLRSLGPGGSGRGPPPLME